MSLREKLGLGGPDETRRGTLPPSLEADGRVRVEEAPEYLSQGSGAAEEASFIAGERLTVYLCSRAADRPAAGGSRPENSSGNVYVAGPAGFRRSPVV